MSHPRSTLERRWLIVHSPHTLKAMHAEIIRKRTWKRIKSLVNSFRIKEGPIEKLFVLTGSLSWSPAASNAPSTCDETIRIKKNVMQESLRIQRCSEKRDAAKTDRAQSRYEIFVSLRSLRLVLLNTARRQQTFRWVLFRIQESVWCYLNV